MFERLLSDCKGTWPIKLGTTGHYGIWALNIMIIMEFSNVNFVVELVIVQIHWKRVVEVTPPTLSMAFCGSVLLTVLWIVPMVREWIFLYIIAKSDLVN